MNPHIEIFLDRDGTIIRDKDYLSHPDQVELEDNALSGLQEMSLLNAKLIVISNQSGVGRGYFNVASVNAANLRVDQLLKDGGVEIDGWFFCPHVPSDKCDCRKPEVGMVEQWRSQFNLRPDKSFVIGDKISDVEVALKIGGIGILIKKNISAKLLTSEKYFVARDLLEAANIVKKLVS